MHPEEQTTTNAYTDKYGGLYTNALGSFNLIIRMQWPKTTNFIIILSMIIYQCLSMCVYLAIYLSIYLASYYLFVWIANYFYVYLSSYLARFTYTEKCA